MSLLLLFLGRGVVAPAQAEIPPDHYIAIAAEPSVIVVPAESWVVHVDADPTVKPTL